MNHLPNLNPKNSVKNYWILLLLTKQTQAYMPEKVKEKELVVFF